MGNNQSSNDDSFDIREDGPLSEEQMKEYLEKTQFSPQDMQHNLLAYRKIGGSATGDGVIFIQHINNGIGRIYILGLIFF